ncbi:GlsB/YeaQ/YmgE family stress response membrane protein [Sanguibacter suaedae]|uniref:GlsB/YeaQ/YmgE family stress response membrane protein n=1 Tax=Sanguibacter suaedae TaxID=2795737 RepID=UPI0027DB6ECB|nr:GlsB/YeaQ/YmgE family stress response membrane protein [Sanguibacter suaedae]
MTTDSLVGLLSWIIIGLVAGAIARAVLPGRAGGGWLTSLVVGVVGAIVGGYIGRHYFGASTNESIFDIGTWLWAFLGSLLVLAIVGLVAGGRSRRSRSRA